MTEKIFHQQTAGFTLSAQNILTFSITEDLDPESYIHLQELTNSTGTRLDYATLSIAKSLTG